MHEILVDWGFFVTFNYVKNAPKINFVSSAGSSAMALAKSQAACRAKHLGLSVMALHGYAVVACAPLGGEVYFASLLVSRKALQNPCWGSKFWVQSLYPFLEACWGNDWFCVSQEAKNIVIEPESTPSPIFYGSLAKSNWELVSKMGQY